ncbi:MAG: 1-acyl-sn-glycerol-3-phosphate acyltransferase, partial [Bacteroidales bacterium]
MKKSGIKKDDGDSVLKIPGGTIFTDTLLRIYRYNVLNRIYSEAQNKDPVTLIDSLLKYLEVRIDIPVKYLENIPSKGPFIAVSNHPYRGIDSMILFKLIYSKRSDIKILGSHLLSEIDPLREVIIAVNTHENNLYLKSSFSGIRKALIHLAAGNCLGIFPSAEDSKHFEAPGIVIDREWNPAAIKMIRAAGVPILPVYFHATIPKIKYLMGVMNPLVNQPFLPAELTRKKNRIINVRIGTPLSLKEQAEINDADTFTRYLRARIYSLGA